ncbi:hypothetical protein F4815DRAFT_13520 [Daldinia loculata]|nr:hypothetical protein F4815DRAFT_13520 [Daldinia loculata]
MENNQLQPDPDQIRAAYQLIADQVPRFANIVAFQQQNESLNLLRDIQARLANTQEQVAGIQEQVTDVQGDIATIRQDITTIRRDITTIRQDIVIVREAQSNTNRRIIILENSRIRSMNKERFTVDSNCTLLPLRNLATGEVIPNSPESFSAIWRLSVANAKEILRALEVPLPVARRKESRHAVLRQYL